MWAGHTRADKMGAVRGLPDDACDGLRVGVERPASPFDRARSLSSKIWLYRTPLAQLGTLRGGYQRETPDRRMLVGTLDAQSEWVTATLAAKLAIGLEGFDLAV